jgi:hypothetical protein
MGQISLEPRPPDVRITATRMIIERFAVDRDEFSIVHPTDERYRIEAS